LTIFEALAFIHSVSWQGSKPGLSRTRELLRRLGNPQRQLQFVHIAGTNGKGSTAAMLASVLREAGYQTGLYTSPYLTRFNERMQIDGAFIPDETLCALTERVAPEARAMADPPTEFEIVTALAMLYFAESGCDAVVLETGMGGRLDSTNVIDAPLCAMITNIGLDHTRELGDTVEKIASEKCGILKPGSSAVLYAQTAGVEQVVRERCAALNIPLRVTEPKELREVENSLRGQIFRYRGQEYHIGLFGAHQLKNAAAILEAVDVLRERGLNIPQEAVQRGLRAARWPGRFELVGERPYFIVDVGHNPQCAETVAECVNTYFPGVFTVMLLGVLSDKDYQSLADILAPAADAFVAATPESSRALPAADLAEVLLSAEGIHSSGKPVFTADSIAKGVALAKVLAGEDGLVVCTGSFYLSGIVRKMIGEANEN